MSEDFLPFSTPTIDDATIEEVVECIKSGWLATGPRVQQLSENFKTYLGAPHALPLTSGTAALHLSLLALNLQPGDEVITTPMTFVASVNMIVAAGGKPVFVDADMETYNININNIEKAITKKTRAIIPVHFAGLPVDLDPLYDLAKKHNLRVIEDAAHAIGAEYKGKKIGSFGDTQIYSFHPTKTMTTGEGGAVTTRDDELAKFVSIMRFHGIDREAWNRFSKKGSQHYDVVGPGFKYNMLDIQAAIGLHQLANLDSFIDKRNKLAQRYFSILKDWPEWQLPTFPNYEFKHGWHICTPLINPEAAGMNRDEFMTAMKEENIGTGLHYEPAHLFSYYQDKFGYKPGDFPNAESIGKRIVSLPFCPNLTETQQDRVIDTMKKVFNKEQ